MGKATIQRHKLPIIHTHTHTHADTHTHTHRSTPAEKDESVISGIGKVLVSDAGGRWFDPWQCHSRLMTYKGRLVVQLGYGAPDVSGMVTQCGSTINSSIVRSVTRR